ESLARHANNRKVWLAVRDRFPHPYTIPDAHEFLQRAVTEQPELKFCIEIAGAAGGGIGVHPGEDVYRHTATVGYWLGEEFWGRGVVTGAILHFGRTSLRCRRELGNHCLICLRRNRSLSAEFVLCLRSHKVTTPTSPRL